MDIPYTAIGKGPACFLLHGGPGFDSSYFHPFVDPLAQRLTLFSVDFCHRHRDHRFTMQGLVEDVERIRRQEKCEKIFLLGHSFGGFLSLAYALRFPQHVLGLILVSTAADTSFVKASEESLKRFPDVARALKRYVESKRTDADYKAMSLAYIPFSFLHPDHVGAVNIFERISYRAQCFEQLKRNDLPSYSVVDRLSSLKISTLVVTGDHDLVVPPPFSTTLAQGMPKSSLVMIQESGHFPFIEQPDYFCEAVDGWLRKTFLFRGNSELALTKEPSLSRSKA